MSWFGKSCSKAVESKTEMESLGIRFETIRFHRDRKEYELLIHLPGCPKDLIKLTYEKPSGVLKLQGRQKIDFLHRFPIPIDCSPTGIYGQFRGEVLHIIMPASKQEDYQKALSDRKSTEQLVEEVRENLPARVPESLPSHQKSTDELTGGGGKDRGKSPASVLEPSSSDQKSTETLTERGKDHDALSARVLSSLPQSDQETTEKLRQRDKELFPEISERQPSVRKPSTSVKELTENYQKNISKTSALPPPPPPPPPPTPRMAAPAPCNRSRKEEGKDQENAERGDHQPENSVVQNESILRKEGSRNVQITLDEDAKNEASAKMEKMLDESKTKEEARKEKIVDESEAKEEAKNGKKEKIVDESKAKDDESKKKKPSAKGKGTLGVVVAKVKETGKTVVEAAKKEENRPMVIVGAAVLALFVIGASLRKKPKN